MNHNEMLGFTNLVGEYKTFIIKDENDNERIKKRMTIFESLFDEKLNVEEIVMTDGTPLYKMITSLMIGLWTSYNLALLNKIDPAPVDIVENFKKKMTE